MTFMMNCEQAVEVICVESCISRWKTVAWLMHPSDIPQALWQREGKVAGSERADIHKQTCLAQSNTLVAFVPKRCVYRGKKSGLFQRNVIIQSSCASLKSDSTLRL